VGIYSRGRFNGGNKGEKVAGSTKGEK